MWTNESLNRCAARMESMGGHKICAVQAGDGIWAHASGASKGFTILIGVQSRPDASPATRALSCAGQRAGLAGNKVGQVLL